VPSSPNQLWVSDITYWKIKDSFLYICFITDAFSKKIVGYHLGNSLETSKTIQALEMAILTISNKKNNQN
jgi:transposase InsO family protein